MTFFNIKAAIFVIKIANRKNCAKPIDAAHWMASWIFGRIFAMMGAMAIVIGER